MFKPFPKIARYHGQCVITEKIDGTNAQILIHAPGDAPQQPDALYTVYFTSSAANPIQLYAGSKSRWLTLEQDNYGFARWVCDNALALAKALPPGRHYGEWYGAGIQRRYGLREKRLALFNPKYATDGLLYTVPHLYTGRFSQEKLYECLDTLRRHGSFTTPFMDPEGCVVYFPARGAGFKLTFDDFIDFDSKLLKPDFHKGGAHEQPTCSQATV